MSSPSRPTSAGGCRRCNCPTCPAPHSRTPGSGSRHWSRLSPTSRAERTASRYRPRGSVVNRNTAGGGPGQRSGLDVTHRIPQNSGDNQHCLWITGRPHHFWHRLSGLRSKRCSRPRRRSRPHPNTASGTAGEDPDPRKQPRIHYHRTAATPTAGRGAWLGLSTSCRTSP